MSQHSILLVAPLRLAVLKYPVGGKENERVSGFGPGSKTMGDEPDYLALARGGSSALPEASSSQATANLPPSITGATAGKP